MAYLYWARYVSNNPTNGLWLDLLSRPSFAISSVVTMSAPSTLFSTKKQTCTRSTMNTMKQIRKKGVKWGQIGCFKHDSLKPSFAFSSVITMSAPSDFFLQNANLRSLYIMNTMKWIGKNGVKRGQIGCLGHDSLRPSFAFSSVVTMSAPSNFFLQNANLNLLYHEDYETNWQKWGKIGCLWHDSLRASFAFHPSSQCPLQATFITKTITCTCSISWILWNKLVKMGSNGVK
jgi:hypothetical protein